MSDVLVIGGGFAGMWASLTAAREIRDNGAALTVTLISREPDLTIRPRLYEAHPKKLSAPLEPSLQALGAKFICANVTAVDPAARAVAITDLSGAERLISYRRLIVATGSVAHVPPVPGFDRHAFSIDDRQAAIRFDAHLANICRQIATAGEASAANTFVIIGAGFTGIELACEMRDRIAVHAGETIAQGARIILLEAAASAGHALGPGPQPQIQAALDHARVEVRSNARTIALHLDAIVLDGGETIATATAVLTAGQKALLPPGLEHFERDAAGRLRTDECLRVKTFSSEVVTGSHAENPLHQKAVSFRGFPEPMNASSGAPGLFAAGDSAEAQVDDDHTALMSCQHAMPMGKFAGFNAVRDLLGLPMRPYRQPGYVTCLDLGRSGAVFTTGWEREVQKTGQEAGALKRIVNTQWIYPPAGTDQEIYDAAHIDKRAGR